MSAPTQAEIDAMFAEPGTTTPAPKAKSNNPFASFAQTAQKNNTQKTPIGQGKAEHHANWGPFYPAFTHKEPADLVGRLAEFETNLNQILAMKEILKLAKIDQDLHRSYYNMWVDESNQTFRAVVRVHKKIAVLRKAKGEPG